MLFTLHGGPKWMKLNKSNMWIYFAGKNCQSKFSIHIRSFKWARLWSKCSSKWQSRLERVPSPMDMPQRNAMGNADSPKWPMTQLWQGKNKFVLWCFMYPITIELLVKALYPTPPNPWLTLQPRNGPCPNSPPWPFSLGAGGCWNAMTMETDPWRQTAASHTSGPRLATKTYAFEVSISVPPMPPGNN